MEDDAIKFTCNSIASDTVLFDNCSLTGVFWVSINEDDVLTQVCINKQKAEQLRDWLTKQLESKA